jgi:hypothetical protein
MAAAVFGLVFAACENPAGSDGIAGQNGTNGENGIPGGAGLMVYDDNDQFIGYLLNGSSTSLTVYNPGASTNYSRIFTVNWEGTFGTGNLYYSGSGGTGTLLGSGSAIWSVIINPYNSADDSINTASPTPYIVKNVDAGGKPTDTPVTSSTSNSYRPGGTGILGGGMYTSAGYEVIPTTFAALGFPVIAGPVKLLTAAP